MTVIISSLFIKPLNVVTINMIIYVTNLLIMYVTIKIIIYVTKILIIYVTIHFYNLR